MQLLYLPIELLDLIILYCVTTEPMTVNLAPTATCLTRSLFPFVSRRKRYTVTNYPYNLLLINRLISRLAFKHIWTQKSLIISLTPSDALCFLLHGLSQHQKDALCKVQLPRFLLSWSFPVNSDIWLIAGKEKGESWYEGAKDPEMEVPGKRFQKLVGMLDTESTYAIGPFGSHTVQLCIKDVLVGMAFYVHMIFEGFFCFF
ncbi:hypothetical protein KCU95_g19641, partial [Aureobasidium melanogenum]